MGFAMCTQLCVQEELPSNVAQLARFGRQCGRGLLELKAGPGSGLKGQTENHEACLCLPGTLHNPESQKAMSAEAEESEKGRKENSRVNSHMNPLFATYEKEKMKLDKLLDDLHAKASVAESAATTLKESFHKVQIAHEEGNCQRATAAAEANFQEVPLCKSDLDQASEDMTVHMDHAQPTCKRGAVALQALREQCMPAVTLMAAAAAAAPARQVAGQATPPPRCLLLSVMLSGALQLVLRALVAPQFSPLPGAESDLKGKALLGATLPEYPLPAVPEAVFQATKPLGASRATCGRPGEPPNKVCLLVSSDLEGFLPYRLLISEEKGLDFASLTPCPDFALDPPDIVQVQRLPWEAWRDDRPFSELRRRIEARRDLQSTGEWSLQDRLWPPYFHLIHLLARDETSTEGSLPKLVDSSVLIGVQSEALAEELVRSCRVLKKRRALQAKATTMPGGV
eukprot:s1483_g15.t1